MKKNNNKYVSILVYPKITVVFFCVPLFLDTFETSSSMYWEESIGCVERPSWEGSSDISYGLFNDWTLPQRLPHHQSFTSTKKDPPTTRQQTYKAHRQYTCLVFSSLRYLNKCKSNMWWLKFCHIYQVIPHLFAVFDTTLHLWNLRKCSPKRYQICQGMSEKPSFPITCQKS